MGKGFLQIRFFVGNHALPVSHVPVIIRNSEGKSIQELTADENGVASSAALETYDKAVSSSEAALKPTFTAYDVEIPFFGGYMKEIIHSVQVYDGITSILPVQMHPAVSKKTPVENTVEITIPAEHGVDLYRGPSSQPYWDKFNNDSNSVNIMEMILANEVSVPEYITVHLGRPDAAAANVRVRFIDYIKNVASSEIYPTWEKAALYANTFAIISFALNRVYTVWYRSRGLDFDITNSTAFDQFFVNGREIFDSINDVVNDIFNVMFLRRPGRREPFFASYCNGTTATCAGMSQTGSQALALQGYAPIDILRNFYPSDIQIVETQNFTSGIVGAFPGIALREGSTGEDVRTMQIYLNRISGNWFMPPAGIPDGVFGSSTKESVVEFQKLFDLVPDGVIGRNTWFAITRIFVAAKELAELTSEGVIIGLGAAPPSATVSQGARGEYVARLQFLLNFISEFYPSIPFIVQNSVFNEDTRNGVIEFQRAFGLTADGIAGPATWSMLYQVFGDIEGTVHIPSYGPEPPTTQIPEFPGTLKQGSRGDDVSFIQNTLNIIAQVYVSIPILATDGIFGPVTQSAVKEFQKIFSLEADGIVGSLTWYRIIDINDSLTLGQAPKFPGTSLKVGSAGNDVMVMQNYLNSLSRIFPSVTVVEADGVFGQATKASAAAFQSLFGLTADGVIGRETWNQIVYAYISRPVADAPKYPGTALRQGSRSDNVKLMQKRLNSIARLHESIPGLTADGVFEQATKASVLAFQERFGLVVDGIIGPVTWNKIISVYNVIIMHMSRTDKESSIYTAANSRPSSGYSDKLRLLLAINMLGKF